MAKETSKIKGTRLSGDLLDFIEGEDNSSQAIRDSIKCFKIITDELDGNYEYHISRALKLYKQYLAKIENLEINIMPNTTRKNTSQEVQEPKKEESKNLNKIGIDGQDISIEELNDNLDNF